MKRIVRDLNEEIRQNPRERITIVRANPRRSVRRNPPLNLSSEDLISRGIGDILDGYKTDFGVDEDAKFDGYGIANDTIINVQDGKTFEQIRDYLTNYYRRWGVTYENVTPILNYVLSLAKKAGVIASIPSRTSMKPMEMEFSNPRRKKSRRKSLRRMIDSL